MPRVVLDTNCLVSALLFSAGQCTWLRTAWQNGRFIPVADHRCASELIRVLNYPKFKLSADEQESLLADYLPYVESVDMATRPAELPEARDADDVIFLALAAAAGADVLVSGDRDLLTLNEVFSVPILSVAEFRAWLDDR
ncbi:putative toxin-antitoxin system toxin component, PIN family [Spiribacter sp. 221]|uniref:putative toxin-antitoxin system toxin component, PIN family n=1 Tax=Spiribacter onubensis TaxID=3122420 RepID=UPI00349F9CE9